MKSCVVCLALSWVVLGAPSVLAGVASPCNSTLPCGIVLVGTDAAGHPDPIGAFTVITRHLSNDPWFEGPVRFDFSACPDVSICSVQVSAGTTVSCGSGNRSVTVIPDATGTVTLTLIGGVDHRASPATAGCLKIFADGVLLTEGTCHSLVTVSALDESGGDGLNPSDLSLWLADYFQPTYMARSDFDHAGDCAPSLGPSDLSRWLGGYFGAHLSGCEALGGSLCP